MVMMVTVMRDDDDDINVLVAAELHNFGRIRNFHLGYVEI